MATMFPSDIRHEEVSPESPPTTDKRKLSEDGKKDDSKKHIFDTDDPNYEYRPYEYESKIDHPIDWETWRKYKKQIEDSEAFEIDDYPGDCAGTYYRPLFDFKKSVATYSLLRDLGKMAVDYFNENNKKGFTFLDIERAVALPSGGVWFKLTITARDPDDDDSVKVLRAEIFHGVFEDEVESCKLKD